MQARPTQSEFYRWGGLAALVGGAIGIVFNVLHPRTTTNPGDALGHMKMVAESGIWRWDHIALGIAITLGLIGVIAIGLSMAATEGDAWARTWLLFTVASSALLLVLISLDGSATKSLSENWAASGNDPAAFAAAALLFEITIALLGAAIATYFGVSPILLGMAVLRSGTYPKLLGQAAFVAGGLGLLTAASLAVQGVQTLNLTILFPIASLLGTAVLMWAGWELYKNHASLGPAGGSTSASVDRTDPPVTPGL